RRGPLCDEYKNLTRRGAFLLRRTGPAPFRGMICCRAYRVPDRRYSGWSVVGHCCQKVVYGHYFCKELVTRVRTSWFSSRRSIVPRYPRRLSANRGEASNLTHSIWPKWVLSPRVKRYLT